MQKADVERNTIFLTLAGSHAYGTNTPTSDVDRRGVCIPDDKAYYTGFMKKFEQYEDPSEDTTVYDLRKALSLIADCNPNMVDLLFADERSWIKTSSWWEYVLDNRELFLSKRARYTYTGYAFAQLKRIKTHRGYLLNPPKKKPERSDYNLPENKKLVNADMLGAFQWVLANILKGTVNYLNLSEPTKEEMENMDFFGMVQRHGGINDQTWREVQSLTGASDEWMEAMRREQAYTNALREWQSYQNWESQRNKARSELEKKYGYDTKHAMHLVRLIRMGKEILGEGKVQVFRPDREELLFIRNGGWTFEQVEEYSSKMEQEIIKVAETSKLPKEPDRIKIDQLCMGIIDRYVWRNSVPNMIENYLENDERKKDPSD
jgi:uncharacterized protein